jgi:DnaJ-domain-containing protein 1
MPNDNVNDNFGENAAWNADQLRYGNLYEAHQTKRDDDDLARAIEEAAARKAAPEAAATTVIKPVVEPVVQPSAKPAPLAPDTSVLRTMNTADASILFALRELELPAVTSIDDVRAAYKRLLMIHHPDTAQGLSAEAQFATAERTHRIHQAYRTLRVALQF